MDDVTPQGIVDSLLGHLLVDGLTLVDGPHHSAGKSVVYVKGHDGVRQRIEVRTG